MSPAATSTPSIDDAALLALGRGSDSWAFLARAVPALDPTADCEPASPGLALLAASHLAKLGLRACALEQLSRLPESIRATAQVQALCAAVGSLKDDEISQSPRWLESNLRALGERLVGLDATAPRSVQRAFVASDGNVITLDGGCWDSFADSKALAVRALADHRATWREQPQAALFIAGCRTPWLFMSASEARPREKLGYRAPICIVEPDTDAFLGAISMSDCSEQLRDDHIRAFVGPNAVELFAAYLRTRIDLRISGTVAHEAGTPTSIFHAVAGSVSEVLAAQQAELPRLEQALRALYAERDLRWWTARLRESPLRILIPTTRYSTFIQHSSRDIAGAFEALGHEARVLLEPDGTSCFSAGAYLRAVRDFEPDLILCINFPRAALGGFLPRNLPWVCWIQDQMPHLFDERLGRSLGAFDFTVGHIVDALHEHYGYPCESSMLLAVPASERKFHAAPATSAERARFECEVAYVSHQSETPEAQHERIVGELRANPSVDNSLLRAMEPLREAVVRHLALPLSTLPFPNMASVVRDSLLESTGAEPSQLVVDLLTSGYAHPLADRMMRHETLAWAGTIAKRRGWRFHLYGRGWESHPTLSEFAKGSLAHDGELRASYQCAGCHLQVTYHTLGHPRLCECILSGGMPLCRFHWGERSMIETTLFKLGWHQGAQFRDRRDGEDVRRSPWTDAPALMKLASVLQGMGVFEDAIAADDAGHCAGYPPGALRGMRWGALFHPRLVPDRIAPNALAYPFAFEMVGEQPEFFFHDQAMLEQRIESVVIPRELRAERIAGARARVENRHTYRAAVARIVDLVRSGLVRRAAERFATA